MVSGEAVIRLCFVTNQKSRYGMHCSLLVYEYDIGMSCLSVHPSVTTQISGYVTATVTKKKYYNLTGQHQVTLYFYCGLVIFV